MGGNNLLIRFDRPSKLDECTATGCGRNGFYAAGQDANVISFYQMFGRVERLVAFLDDSFLGNNYTLPLRDQRQRDGLTTWR